MSWKNGSTNSRNHTGGKNASTMMNLKKSIKQSLRDSKSDNTVRRILRGDAQVYDTTALMPRTRSIGEQTFRVAQTVEVILAVTTSTTVPVFFSQAFQLADLDQYTTLTALFDQYKFDSVEAWIVPVFGHGVTSINVGMYTSVIDFDDDAVLSTNAQALDYSNSLTTGGQAGQYRRFTPSSAVAMYSGAFTSFGNDTNQWIDAGSPTVKHYGLKLAFQPSAQANTYNLILRYHLSFKSVR